MAMTPAENAYWSQYGYHRGRTVLRNLPEVFAIESTSLCNIKCIMCPRGDPEIMTRSVGHMSTELLEHILDEVQFFCSPCWFHWFGEPLMNPRLFEQIEVAKRKVPNLGLSNNATLLTDENIDRILDSQLDTLVVSVDGATKDVYERVRKGSFEYETVRDNILRYFAKRRERRLKRPLTVLSLIVMEETAPQAGPFVSFWSQQGADEVLLKPFVNWGGQHGGLTQLAPQNERRNLLSPREHPCRNLWTSVVIAWDGRVVPCCFDYDAKQVMGDLTTTSIADIWNGPAYVALRKAELEGKNLSPLCARCSQAPGHARDPNWG